jgi:hypothetical protein
MRKYLTFFAIIFNIAYTTAQYSWDNVAIGGGGFIIGGKIHPKNNNIVYVRTDVGGMYRWDASEKRMHQLMNWVPFEQWNLYGVAGIALHPTDTNKLYIACGKYDYRDHHGVFMSNDKGNTWVSLNFTGKFGSNMHPHRKGDPLELNPHNPEELWCGTKGDGLWKYKNSTWTKITSVPAGESVRNVCFNPLDSNYIYVSVYGDGVYRSSDAGKNFSKVGIVPTGIYDMDISKNGDKLYIACRADGIRLLTNAKTNTTWVDVSPPATSNRCVTASPYDNDVVLTFKGEYGSLTHFYVSTNSGTSWTKKDKVNVDQHIPWHSSGYPGSAVSHINFDPVNPKTIYFGDWYSYWKTEDYTASTITWSNEMGYGHEEVVTAMLRGAHPNNTAGAYLYSGHADVSGFMHTEMRNYPAKSLRGSLSTGDANLLTEVTGADYAEKDPDFVAILGGSDWNTNTAGLAISTNGGKTLSYASGYTSTWGAGRVVVSSTSTSKTIVVATQNNGIVYSTNNGTNFSQSTGDPGTLGIGGIFNYVHPIAADRENSNVYVYRKSNGGFYRSTDGGASFSLVYTLPTTSSTKINVEAVFGYANHVFVTVGNSGLYKTTNAGDNWTKINNVSVAELMAIGKAAPGKSYPTIYIWGKANGDTQYWFYRSVDEGVTWQKVNDANNRVGNSTQAMGADRKVFGRLYVGTNGSGVWYGADLSSPDNPDYSSYLTVNPTSLNFNKEASSNTFQITSNVGWTITKKQSWLSLSKTSGSNNDEINVTVLENSGSDRTDTITVNSGDSIVKKIIITQASATLTTIYQAESYTLQSGCSIRSDITGFTGTGFVDMGGNGTYFEWNNVSSSTTTNSVQLTIFYANGSTVNRSCNVLVNGVMIGSINCEPTGDWTIWSSNTITVPMNAGVNTVRITANSANGGPNVDKMEVNFGVITNSSLVIEENNQINIYPNPSSGRFVIQHSLEGTIKVEIINITGNTIMLFNSNDTSIIIDEKLNAGMYFITVSNKVKLVTTKLIIK